MTGAQFPKVAWILTTSIFIFLTYIKISFNIDVVEDQFLKNILHLEVPLGESIFILDTGLLFRKTNKIGLHPRAACAVESASRAHPQRSIFMLYATRGHRNFEATPSNKIVQLLSEYDNIHFGYINIEEYGKGTPAETLMTKKTIDLSEYKVAHTSDMLRVLTLWKYGGIYMDTDVIVLKSFDALAPNFVGVESTNDVASGVLAFNHTGTGHDYISSVLEAFVKNYNYMSWSANGPVLFTALVKRVCKVDKLDDVIGRECEELNIYPKEYFYPVYYPSWRYYFEDQYSQKVKEMINNSYAIHVWNKLSSEEKININSNAPYLDLARKYCPRVISAVDDFF